MSNCKVIAVANQKNVFFFLGKYGIIPYERNIKYEL